MAVSANPELSVFGLFSNNWNVDRKLRFFGLVLNFQYNAATHVRIIEELGYEGRGNITRCVLIFVAF